MKRRRSSRAGSTDPKGNGVRAPRGVEAHTFAIGSDEYVILTFSLQTAPPRRLEGLTVAEREIVEMALSGASNVDIAHARSTSMQTVANQLGAIYRKLGVCSRRELRAHWCSLQETP